MPFLCRLDIAVPTPLLRNNPPPISLRFSVDCHGTEPAHVGPVRCIPTRPGDNDCMSARISCDRNTAQRLRPCLPRSTRKHVVTAGHRPPVQFWWNNSYRSVRCSNRRENKLTALGPIHFVGLISFPKAFAFNLAHPIVADLDKSELRVGMVKWDHHILNKSHTLTKLLNLNISLAPFSGHAAEEGHAEL